MRALHRARFVGGARDQFMPSISVDRAGTVGICYADRRDDPMNFKIAQYCSLSKDQGTRFEDSRQTKQSWFPTHDNDAFVNTFYMGDYDATTADLTGMHEGFFTSFQVQVDQNPDVYGALVR